MTDKEIFIDMVEKAFERTPYEIDKDSDSTIAKGWSYWESFKTGKVTEEFTETGAKIIVCMQKNEDAKNNMFTSKSIGEELFMSSRSISGSIRKLVEQGYVKKAGTNPVIYGLTDKGRSAQV